jgi:acetyl-CoA carboxylase biotin carboxylase subunit
MAKLIVWGKDREEARRRALRALDEFVLDGVKSTIPFHQIVLNHPEFVKGKFDTRFVELYM